MKDTFLVCLVCFLTLNLSAQTKADRFNNYEDMQGAEIKLYNASSMAEFQGFYAYTLKNEKPYLIKDEQVYETLEKNNLVVDDIVVLKKKRFLEVSTSGNTYYLILDAGFSYLDNIRSVDYWKQYQQKISNEYQYLRIESDLLHGKTAEVLPMAYHSKYLKVQWHPIVMPQKLKDEVVFVFNLAGLTSDIYSFTIEETKKYSGDFIDSKQFEQEKREREMKIKEEKRKQEQKDSILDNTIVVEARIKHTNSSESILAKYDIEYTIDKADLKLTVYGSRDSDTGYTSAKNQKVYKGFVLSKDVEIPETELEFINIEAKYFIDRRGLNGEQARKTIAESNDIANTQAYLDRLESEMHELEEKVNAIKNFCKKNKVFIFSEQYSFSRYKFGLEFKLYNCFDKEIKYVEMRIVAFNQVGDVQRDDIGNYAKDVRCIGPFESGELGVYNFDELFWDDNDIIKELRVVEIKITFSDNSVLSFSGKTKVDKLRLSNYDVSDINI